MDLQEGPAGPSPSLWRKTIFKQMVTFSIFGLGPAVMKICHRELGGGKDFVVLAF